MPWVGGLAAWGIAVGVVLAASSPMLGPAPTPLGVVGRTGSLASVRILAAHSYVDVGATDRLAALAFDSAGHPLPSVNFSWTATPSQRAALNATFGEAVALRGGPFTGPVYLVLRGTWGGEARTAYATVPVEPTGATPLAISEFTVYPTPVQAGASTQFVVNVSGGAPPYEFVYSGLPPVCTSVNASSFFCTPKGGFVAPTTYEVTLNVSDTNGANASARVNVTVVPAAGPTTTEGPTVPTWAVWLAVGLFIVALAVVVAWSKLRQRRETRAADAERRDRERIDW